MDISPGKSLPVLLENSSDRDRELAERYKDLLERVAKARSVRPLESDEVPPPSATALLGDLRVLVPLKGIIDVEAEQARLTKKQAGLRIDLGKTEGKLANRNFVSNAPEVVVTKERARRRDLESQIAKLQEQLEKLENLD
jgi:valyl-tRNA synthetase